MSERQIYNIAVDTELDFTYFANNKHNNNYALVRTLVEADKWGQVAMESFCNNAYLMPETFKNT